VLWQSSCTVRRIGLIPPLPGMAVDRKRSEKLQIHIERRKLERLPLEVILRITVPERPGVSFGETRNVSARGIFFHTWARFELGQYVDGVLVLPEKLTLAEEPTLVGCKGRVVRMVEPKATERIGVAMEIHSFDFSAKPEPLTLGREAHAD
jgi:hypothetical protein